MNVVDNPAPNATEHKLAREIATALEYWGPVDVDPINLAGMLALVRDGYTLEGPRRIVSGHAQIPIQHAHEGIDAATVHAWRSWFGELLRHGLRPCGWPAAQTTYLAYALLANGRGPYVEVDAEHAEIVVVSVTCEAVPAT